MLQAFRRCFTHAAAAGQSVHLSASTASLRIHRVPVTQISAGKRPGDEVVSARSGLRLGNLFDDFDVEQCRVERWPQPSWRPVSDGLSGGDNTTEGDFILRWTEDGVHFASNTGVADGDYAFAWRSPEEAVAAATQGKSAFQLFNVHGGTASEQQHTASKHTGDNNDSDTAYLFTEINYHACGSQLFFTRDAPVVLLLARPPADRFPDDVQPDDFEALLVPPGLGVNVDTCVWHSPPLALSGQATTMRTRQARVHSKVYYDPLAENGVLLSVDLSLPDNMQ
eukprot:INCI938.1.p1 GENE.INCI938.1~~INCI938.1.p1  ORF type:complete len:281 (-),score=40.99 INCI938.1:26-868(-)